MRFIDSAKNRVFDTIRDDDVNSIAGTIFDSCIIVLILLNVALVIADTFDSIPVAVRVWFPRVEAVSLILFTLEYGLRVWVSPLSNSAVPARVARLRYIISFMALVALASILPFYLPFVVHLDLRILRMLRLLRMLRVLKINRYTSTLSIIGDVLKRKTSQLISSIFVVLLLMVVASVVMYSMEHDAQPNVFTNAFSGLWRAVATLTTVGYGDIFPITVAGKILSSCIALLGIGLVAVPTGIISAGFMERIAISDSGETVASFPSEPLCSTCPFRNAVIGQIQDTNNRKAG
jgi:voltage-gated potassium channel